MSQPDPGTSNKSSEQYGDGALRGIHRIAAAEPDKRWAASVVEHLAAEVIRLRGTDLAWIALHCEVDDVE